MKKLGKKVPKKILIIEDETDLREALSSAFINEGFTTFTAANGEIGLERAYAEKPDIIILDIIMPKIDGLSVLKNLRSDEWGKSVKVVVMTALDDLEKVAEVVEAGGTEYIVKTNISLSGIVEKIKNKVGISNANVKS